MRGFAIQSDIQEVHPQLTNYTNISSTSGIGEMLIQLCLEPLYIFFSGLQLWCCVINKLLTKLVILKNLENTLKQEKKYSVSSIPLELLGKGSQWVWFWLINAIIQAVAQCAQWILLRQNWKNFQQDLCRVKEHTSGFRIYFIWNPKLLAIESTS